MPIGAELMSKAATALEAGFDKVISKGEGSSTGRGLLNLFGNQSWELSLTEGGRAVEKMHNDYIRIHDQTLGQHVEQMKQLRDWHQNSNTARNKLNVKDATMMDYHQQAVAENHPVAQLTQKIISDPEAAKMTQKDFMIRGQQQARLAAIAGTYGNHFENATPIIAKMLQDKDPRVVNNAHRIADIISNQVRDTKMLTEKGGTHTEQSYAKFSMNKAFQKANKIMEKAGEGKRIPLLNTESTYIKPSEGERLAHRVLDTMLIPFVAVKHIGQFFNPIATSPLSAMGASLLRMDHAEMEKTIEASGIVASTVWRAMYRDVLGESGKVAEWTNSPTLGKILARSIHSPGMSVVRRLQINTAGSIGFHSAIYWAHNFVQNGSKIAEYRLKEMGLDPAEVLKQGGKLTEEQLAKGVYHYTNNREFMSKSIDNALYQNRNVFARAGFMYHSFVNTQASFMRREMLQMAKAGDFKGIAQFVGTLAVLFPATAAPLLGAADVLLRTASLKQSEEDLKDHYQKMVHPSSTGEWLGNYFDLVSHLGAAGVYFNYLNAIKANRLAAAFTGPMAGAILTDVTDATRAAFFPSKTGKRNLAPLERDLLKQTIPVFGSALAHQLVPTAAEQKLRSGTTVGTVTGLSSRRRSGRRR